MPVKHCSTNLKSFTFLDTSCKPEWKWKMAVADYTASCSFNSRLVLVVFCRVARLWCFKFALFVSHMLRVVDEESLMPVGVSFCLLVSSCALTVAWVARHPPCKKPVLMISSEEVKESRLHAFMCKCQVIQWWIFCTKMDVILGCNSLTAQLIPMKRVDNLLVEILHLQHFQNTYVQQNTARTQ